MPVGLVRLRFQGSTITGERGSLSTLVQQQITKVGLGGGMVRRSLDAPAEPGLGLGLGSPVQLDQSQQKVSLRGMALDGKQAL